MSHAWLFPGQGAQKVGMGRALFEQSPRAREVFERADDALGFSVSKLCFEGPEEQLRLTKNTQPAIVTMSIASLEALRESSPNLPEPAFVAGHSLGEYSALVAAGSLSLEDAVQAVHARGDAMQEAVPAGAGAMAAIIGGDEETVLALCRDAQDGEALSPANFNAPGQIVIAGTSAAVKRALVLAKSSGLKGIPLKVSAPFHCALMAPAAEKMKSVLDNLQINSPRIPIVANVTALPNDKKESIPDLLVRQVDSAVLWDRSIRFMKEQGVDRALEIGPGKVLSGLVKRIERSLRVKTIGIPEDLNGVQEFLT